MKRTKITIEIIVTEESLPLEEGELDVGPVYDMVMAALAKYPEGLSLDELKEVTKGAGARFVPNSISTALSVLKRARRISKDGDVWVRIQ